MSLRNFVTIVCSPRPRVGKTFLARMLADFHLHNERAIAAFDLNQDDPALTEFMPAHCAPAEVADIHGQMALFDRLVVEDGAQKIVDLGHPSFRQFFAVMREIGVTAELRRRGITPVILFLATPDAVSVEAFTALRTDFPQAAIVPVHNEIPGNQYRDKFAVSGPGAVPLHVAFLAPGLRKAIDRRPFSFADLRTAPLPGIGLETHNELQRWLRRLYLQFREMELRVLLSDLQSSLNVQP